MKRKIRNYLGKLKNLLKRFNQVFLSAPIWLVLGLSGMFRSFEKEGWKESKKNENYEGMY
jgi:hypothetical protein